MKHFLALCLVLAMLLCVASAEGLEPMEETITLTTCRTMTETAVFDESNPLKKNYQENLWTILIWKS